MRKKVIAGNWKMNLGVAESIALINELKPLVADAENVEIVVCPSPQALYSVGQNLNGCRLRLGAQNLYPVAKGAYTGEVSPTMIKEVGCTYCILGHSERREYFKETDEFVNAKIKACIENAITPIICVGESLAEREAGVTFDRVGTQVKGAFKDILAAQAATLVIAYEPIWAIGTGKTATDEQAQEVHAFIRAELVKLYGAAVANEIPVLYGGSVKADNIDGLMAKPDIDGALVGGASLKADGFARIAKFKI